MSQFDALLVKNFESDFSIVGQILVLITSKRELGRDLLSVKINLNTFFDYSVLLLFPETDSFRLTRIAAVRAGAAARAAVLQLQPSLLSLQQRLQVMEVRVGLGFLDLLGDDLQSKSPPVGTSTKICPS